MKKYLFSLFVLFNAISIYGADGDFCWDIYDRRRRTDVDPVLTQVQLLDWIELRLPVLLRRRVLRATSMSSEQQRIALNGLKVMLSREQVTGYAEINKEEDPMWDNAFASQMHGIFGVIVTVDVKVFADRVGVPPKYIEDLIEGRRFKESSPRFDRIVLGIFNEMDRNDSSGEDVAHRLLRFGMAVEPR